MGPAFFKRLADSKGSAFGRPPQRAKLLSRCASGATQKEGKAARRPPADVPAAAISKKLRHDALLIYPKRKTAPAAACRRSHAAAAVFFASSFISRATGCAATEERARKIFGVEKVHRKTASASRNVVRFPCWRGFRSCVVVQDCVLRGTP